MAVTKIHGIRATVSKAVDYICDPAKTDSSILISSFGCSPETAAYDFRFALSKTSQSDPNKAFHLIQSFAPGEVSYDEAHKIGEELADKLLDGKYSYIIATHIDKDHVHNHIIFCAADNIEHRKYHDCRQSYRRIRQLSDNLCREHGLSIISPSQEKDKSYKEWLVGKEQRSWKTALKNDIDAAIAKAENYDDFCRLMREKGYEVKGEDFGENALKYISFRAAGYERFVRGSVKTLGADYTKERIRERIENRELPKEKLKAAFPSKPKKITTDHSRRSIIDTSQERFTQSPGLKHWADLQNLKTAAASYNAAGSIVELEQQIKDKAEAATTAKEKLIETERRLKELTEVLRYAEQYKENRIYHVRYENSHDKERYLRTHETRLILYDGAKTMLQRLGIRPSKDLDVDKIRSDYEALSNKREARRKEYKAVDKGVRALQHRRDELHQYLGSEKEAALPGPDRRKSNHVSL